MIGEPLADEALKREIGARYVIYAELGAIGIAEIKFREVAVKVALAAMLIDALHAALEHAEEAFNGVGGDNLLAFIAAIFLRFVINPIVAGELIMFVHVFILASSIGHDRGVVRHVGANDRHNGSDGASIHMPATGAATGQPPSGDPSGMLVHSRSEALGNRGPGPALVSDGVCTLHAVEPTARKAYSLGGILPRAM